MTQPITTNQYNKHTVSLTSLRCINNTIYWHRCQPSLTAICADDSVCAIVCFLFFSYSYRAAESENAGFT